MLPEYVTWDHIIDVLLYKSIMANFSNLNQNSEFENDLCGQDINQSDL